MDLMKEVLKVKFFSRINHHSLKEIKKLPHFGEAFGLFLECFCLLLASVELIDGARFEESFLSCIVWMTLRAGFYSDLITFYRTSCFESISARTDDFDHLPAWVHIFFHRKSG